VPFGVLLVVAACNGSDADVRPEIADEVTVEAVSAAD
jgi:hypothetical protein